MREVVETIKCDYCGKEIGFAKLQIYSPVRYLGDFSFNFTLGTSGGGFRGHEYCSEDCFVRDIALVFGVNLLRLAEDIKKEVEC